MSFFCGLLRKPQLYYFYKWPLPNWCIFRKYLTGIPVGQADCFLSNNYLQGWQEQGGRGGVYAPQNFGRIEGANSSDGIHAALLLAHPHFQTQLVIPDL